MELQFVLEHLHMLIVCVFFCFFWLQALDVAKQVEVAELLGHYFISRGRGRDQNLFSPTENVTYEKGGPGGEGVHIGVDWPLVHERGDAVCSEFVYLPNEFAICCYYLNIQHFLQFVLTNQLLH